MRHPTGKGSTEPHEDGFRTWVAEEIDVYISDDPSKVEPLEDFIRQMRESAEGLTDPGVTGGCYVDRDRDERGMWLIITGCRPATEEEIATWQEKERLRVEKETRQAEETARREAERRAEADRKALERARAAYPHLFKDNAS